MNRVNRDVNWAIRTVKMVEGMEKAQKGIK